MQYAFLLTPHPNAAYRQALARLGPAELQCMLGAWGVRLQPWVEEIGGAAFCLVETPELPPAVLAALSPLSCACLWARREGDALRPFCPPVRPYLSGDMAEWLKYKGKTNAAFTTLLINLARSQSAFAQAAWPLTVADPLCGRGTTLYCALAQGMHAVGMDRDQRDLHEAVTFTGRYLREHRVKHELRQGSRTLPGGEAVPEAAFTLADTREHYAQGDRRELRFFLGDTRRLGAVLRKRPAELLTADLPYGVQHAPERGGKAESFEGFLRSCLPAWREALRPGGAMALAFNSFTLPKKRLAAWAQDAGWEVVDQPPLDDLAHDVEQAVRRDVLICRRG